MSRVITATRYAVARNANSWRLTYGRLVSALWRVGNAVVIGAAVGRASGASYLVRAEEPIIDPEPFVRELHGQLRLISVDGRNILSRTSHSLMVWRLSRPGNVKAVVPPGTTANSLPRRSKAVAFGRRSVRSTATRRTTWLLSACARCLMPEHTSVTRPAGGTQR